MVKSKTKPALVQQVKDKTYLRSNVQQVTETDEMSGEQVAFYEYNETIVQGYSEDFASEKFDDILNYPDKYNVVMRDGKRIIDPKGVQFAKLQEKELSSLNDALDILIIDSLGA